MKILSPISRKEEVEPLVEAGAGELYCGIVPRLWSDRYGVSDTLNRREGYGANFSSFADLQYAIQLAHKRNVPVFVTINGLYTREQYPLIREIVEKLISIKVDGLIIADLGLLLTLERTKFPGEIHMGTGGTAFNSRTISFYKELGASRIILDRHLTIGEIKDISQKSSSII
ncbi:U32 family peptidase, partial [bacterium]